MNIAFYTYNECCPSIGGTERTTSLVASALKNIYGYKVYSIYSQQVLGEFERYEFEDSFRVTYNNLKEDIVTFLKQNEISLIVNQGDFKFGVEISKIIKQHNLNTTQIFALHFSPGSFEEAHISMGELKRIWIKRKSIAVGIKILLYPLYYSFLHSKFRKQYTQIERVVDKIVLLSDNYKNEWENYRSSNSDKKNINNIIAIPNGTSFSHYANEQELLEKEKRILIVARLDERQKRLTKALKIWSTVADNQLLFDWHLDIVGDGPDRLMYEKYVKENNIPRVIFHGYENPESFYKRSSMFMMTSDFEGFSMTLIEASQYGVIPMAMNTYSALTDIITDGENGFIFSSTDYTAYINQIIELAADKTKRLTVASNAVKNAKRFSIDSIARKWDKLISEVTKNSN